MAENKIDKLSKGRQELVTVVLDKLSHDINPWVKPWDASKGAGSYSTAPRNAVSGREYTGINNFNLTLLGELRGYEDPRWATFNQIKNKGWHLQAGSKGVSIEVVKYYDKLTKKDVDFSALEKLEKEERLKYWKENVRFILQYFTVFNAAQIDGIEPLPKEEIDVSTIYDRAAKIIKNSEARIYHNGGDKAYYRPYDDTIHLPDKKAFDNEEGYYGVAFHEISHSTGHVSRLNRDMRGMFGSDAYAKEELVAEVSSMFISQDTGIRLDDRHIENHSAYIKSWKKHIESDPNYLFEAIGLASKAADYVLQYEFGAAKKNSKDNLINSLENSAQKSNKDLFGNISVSADPAKSGTQKNQHKSFME